MAKHISATATIKRTADRSPIGSQSAAGRREVQESRAKNKNAASVKEAAFFGRDRKIARYRVRGDLKSVLGRPGSDLLSQGLSHSTIGAEEFNGRVRDGIGFRLLARTTRPAKDKEIRSKLKRGAFKRSPRT